MDDQHRMPVRVHLTNVSGMGATQLLRSLLPALELNAETHVERIYLPADGLLSKYVKINGSTITELYKRYLPNSLSRLLECTWLANRFSGTTPLLVLGDIPLRCVTRQTVLVHQLNLIGTTGFRWSFSAMKFSLMRMLFAFNLPRVHAIIVQTEVMGRELMRCFPGATGKVHVVAQPVPSWLLSNGLRRTRCRERAAVAEGLHLIYPAAGYAHKNHALLSKIRLSENWPIKRLILTLDAVNNPSPENSWIDCVGRLDDHEMIDAYSSVDGLVFLSKAESYGFPLVEAMHIGLPIICPDLPYAHALCGDHAIYFDPDQPDSLYSAVCMLNSRLNDGWWPNWEDRLASIPKDWAAVARRMLEIACNDTGAF